MLTLRNVPDECLKPFVRLPRRATPQLDEIHEMVRESWNMYMKAWNKAANDDFGGYIVNVSIDIIGARFSALVCLAHDYIPNPSLPRRRQHRTIRHERLEHGRQRERKENRREG